VRPNVTPKTEVDSKVAPVFNTSPHPEMGSVVKVTHFFPKEEKKTSNPIEGEIKPAKGPSGTPS
jgi:hypothetical protein